MRKKEVIKYLSLLKILKNTKNDPPKFRCLVECFDEKTVKFLCEGVKNAISKKHVTSLPSKQRKEFLKNLLPRRKLIKKICKKSSHYTRSKKKLIQEGSGFIIPLISTLIPLITSFVAGL